jgi:hypothetical protein
LEPQTVGNWVVIIARVMFEPVQISSQKLIDLAEAANRVAFVELRVHQPAVGFGSLICASIRPLRGKVRTFCVETLGDDRAIVAATMNSWRGLTWS